MKPFRLPFLAVLLALACAGRGDGIERIHPDGATTLATYTPAVRADDFIFFSGQIGLIPGTRQLAEGGVGAETEQALANLDALLEAAGVDRTDIVKCTVFLADIGDYGAMNEVYGAFFGGTPPARSAVAVAALPAGASVEIECIARQ